MTRRQHNYYVGYAPDVKAYLEGNPLSMFIRDYPTRKHIDIYYNASILGKVTTEQIYNRGAITLSLVDILESIGFGVELHIFTLSYVLPQVHYAKFNLKRSDERLNIQKLYFPLCNPSFLRRLVFRLREGTLNISKEWEVGYGKTANYDMIRDIIDLKNNDIIICQPEEMDINGYDIIEDAKNMFLYLNTINKDFKLKKINH